MIYGNMENDCFTITSLNEQEKRKLSKNTLKFVDENCVRATWFLFNEPTACTFSRIFNSFHPTFSIKIKCWWEEP